MITFTWNVARNVDAFALACAYLARLGTCVAAFQEPPEVDDDKIRLWSSGKLRLLTRDVPIPSTKDPQQPIRSSLVLLTSDDIMIDPAGVHHQYNPLLDKSRRFEGVSLVSRNGTNFQILGAHELDPANHETAEEHELSGTLLRRALHDFWAGCPLIGLGDFHGNPFARLLSDQSATPQGTYHHRSKATDLCWHCIDQIIVSPDLEPHLGTLETLTSLMDASLVEKSLVTEQGLPNEELYSDHLPVQMVIDLDKVRR